MAISPIVSCAGCGVALDEPTNLDPELRKPCGDCGSLTRSIIVELNGELSFQSGLGIKLVRGATDKVAMETFEGASQSADGSIAQVTMVRDHETGRDVKHVVLADGTETRRVDGDLREHTGRGSDRPDLREAREADRRAKAEQRAALKKSRDEAWRRRQSAE